MTVDVQTLSSWTADLGLQATVDVKPTGEVLSAITDTGDVFSVSTMDTGCGAISHRRRISRADADALWGASAAPESPDPFTHIVENLANGFPLVRISVTDEGQDFLVSFDSPLFLDGLNRQAYVLTLSGVMRATATLGMLQQERARLIEAWAELDAEPGSSETGSTQQATCPNCGAPVDSGDSFCGSCGQPLVRDQERVANRDMS